MGQEIERKFLVRGDGWRRDSDEGSRMRQGYLAVGPPASVRVRVSGSKARLNIKRSTLEIARDEFEYSIPIEDAQEMLESLCVGALVEKTRYRVAVEGLTWEVDVFEGQNAGLVVAEVELENVEQPVTVPDWAGEEVSGDPRYLNSYLSRRPYSTWAK